MSEPTGARTAPKRIVLWCGDEPGCIDEMTAADWERGDVSWAVFGSLTGVPYVRADLVSHGLSPTKDRPNFTEGPWRYIPFENPQGWVDGWIAGKGNHMVAEIENATDGPLIAAAPDLYGALREAVEAYGTPGGPWNVPGEPGGPWNVPGEPGGWLERARAALARAEGREVAE